MLRILLISLCISVTACGPSKDELRRQQILEIQRKEQLRIEAEQLAAERDVKVQARLNEARNAWNKSRHMTNNDINAVFDSSKASERYATTTHYVELELQAAKYNYKERKQSFVIVGVRNPGNDEIYRGLFSAFQPSNQNDSDSILELTVKDQKIENRLGQLVEKPNGQRWIAAIKSFKYHNTLATIQSSWRWESSPFEDISWFISPEDAFEHTKDRALTVQVGLRFCPIEQCRTKYNSGDHPVNVVKADVISILVGNRATGRVLSEFVREEA